MPTVKCKCCKNEFNARQADINRGWGKFCSKSCKAIKQEQKIKQHSNYLHRQSRAYSHEDYDPSDDEYWSGKDY